MSSIRVPGKVYRKKTVRFDIPDGDTLTYDEQPFPTYPGDEESDSYLDVGGEEVPQQHARSFGWEPQTAVQIEELWREVAENGTSEIPFGYLIQLAQSL